MANTDNQPEFEDGPPSRLHLREFRIFGLFGGSPITIKFPDPIASDGPAIVILSGSNGIGKTTILRMIGGMLQLDFDEFRRVPFHSAELEFSSSQVVEVKWIVGSDRPVFVSFEELSMGLVSDREQADYNSSEQAMINTFRERVLPLTRGIKYDLLELDRSSLQRLSVSEEYIEHSSGRIIRKSKGEDSLAVRVRNFLRDAQVNHRRFFRSEELDVLPKLLDRLTENHDAVTVESLVERLASIRIKIPEYERLGLYIDDEQLSALSALIGSERRWSAPQLALIETYVETQEGIQKARELIANRLIQFEAIMQSFLIGKSVTVNRRTGLRIEARGTILKESQLSSGEYHFLFMMVTALLCQRIGTIIAIDEPELSLHISWQRKLISALSRCAAGASPLFLFATHSLAIAAEHPESVNRLSPVD